jgi:quercetin dioxygenase-like cupin family protein
MGEPTVVPAGGGEVVGDAPDRRVEILADHDAVHVTWTRFGPRRDGADLHVHRCHTDLFYVLEGEFTLRLGLEGDTVTAPAGTLVRVPPLVVHGFRNASDRDVRYLNFHAPGEGFADYLRALRDGRSLSYDQHPPPEDGGRPIAEAVIGRDGVVAERAGMRIELLADVEEIAVAEVRVDAGDAVWPADPDRDVTEWVYVLEGEVVVQDTVAGPGSWVELPAGTPHRPAAGGPVRFLSVRAPAV